MSQKTHAVINRTIGIDTGKNTLHLVGLDDRGTIVLREKLGRSRIRTRLANIPPLLDRYRGRHGDALCGARADCARS